MESKEIIDRAHQVQPIKYRQDEQPPDHRVPGSIHAGQARTEEATQQAGSDQDHHEEGEDRCRKLGSAKQLLRSHAERQRQGSVQDLGNLTYARWFDSVKATKGTCWLGDGKKADIVEALLELGWYYAENKDKELECIKE
eukprot:8775287-Heterocapsa_arctica.AAC.1